MKTLEFKLALNVSQMQSIDRWLDVQRWVWNRGLGLLKEFEAFSSDNYKNKFCEGTAPCCPLPWAYRWVHVEKSAELEWRDPTIISSLSKKDAQFIPIVLPLVTGELHGRIDRPTQCPLLQRQFEQGNASSKKTLTEKVDSGEIVRTWPEIKAYRHPELQSILDATPMTKGGRSRKGEPTPPRRRNWKDALSEAMGHGLNPILADSGVPAKVTQTTVKILTDSWSKYLYKKGGCPQFKRRNGQNAFKTLSNNNPGKDFTKHGRLITLPGTKSLLGKLKVKTLDKRLIDGSRINSYRIVKEPSGYYLLLVGEIQHEQPKPSTKACGFDAGVVHLLNDDAGHHIDIPYPLQRRLKALKRLSRKASRQQKGSANQHKTYARMAKLHEKVRRDRKAWHHKLSTFAVRKYEAIAVEKLNLQGLSRRPKPKLREDGRGYEPNMATAKAGLNRKLLDVGIGQLYRFMEAKAKAFGRRFEKVPAHHTSQTCNHCGVVDKASRKSQSEFVCKHCGYTVHADTNAAMNIRDAAFPEYRRNYPAWAGDVKPVETTKVQPEKQEAISVAPISDADSISNPLREHVDKDCKHCGHEANADENAAQNIRDTAFPEYRASYLALAGKVKSVEPARVQAAKQEEVQTSPMGDAHPIPNSSSRKKQKLRSAQSSAESYLQLSFLDVFPEMG